MRAVSIDPITLAVLQGRLEQVVDEMDATLFRSAFNPIIAEAHDASHGIYDRESGATLAQGKSGLPIFVGTMSFAVKMVIDKVAREGGLGAGVVDADFGLEEALGRAFHGGLGAGLVDGGAVFDDVGEDDYAILVDFRNAAVDREKFLDSFFSVGDDDAGAEDGQQGGVAREHREDACRAGQDDLGNV